MKLCVCLCVRACVCVTILEEDPLSHPGPHLAPTPHRDVQHVGTDSNAGGQQHGTPLDVVVTMQQADEGQV